ncbi:MAG: ROK family protein [Nitrospirales bacterium]|nr:ROK family protein [Nitrospirales bacterium]
MSQSPNRLSQSNSRPVTFAIDIGGSGIKALLLDPKGNPTTDKLRILTPKPSTPKAVIDAILELSKSLPAFDRISVGFPGVVQEGRVKTAPNLDPTWSGIHLVKELERKLGKPVRAANDADVQGHGAIEGKGVELVITLGTGFGTALFVNGHLVPNLEIAHHPFKNGHTYEEALGASALEKIGKKQWNQRLAKAIKILDRVINYDCLFIGGGNAKKVTLKLPDNVSLVSNVAGLLGGIALWREFQETVLPQKSPVKRTNQKVRRPQKAKSRNTKP